jgi:iron complex outermembrane receptor protein
MIGYAFRKHLNLVIASSLAFTGALAFADRATAGGAVAATPAATAEEPEVGAVIVTAPANRVTAVTPVRGALKETEPKAIITRKFIEESASRIGDHSNIAAFAPSMVATPNPNGPGSGDGSKIALRGFSDGNFNITYDGIAWGDTNGPSHHGTAFFTASTIGGIIVDRGPGNATDIGLANFGGSVNLLSLPLEPTPSATQVGTLASFGTWQAVTTFQSGVIQQLHDAQIVANFQENATNGYQSFTRSDSQSQFVKVAVPVTSRITLTGLYTHTGGAYNKSDIGDAPVSLTEIYGENYALSNNPNSQDYYKYNTVDKNTNFEYLRAEGDLGGGFGFNNTLYGYDYNNTTVSGATEPPGANVVYTLASIQNLAYPAPGKTYPTSAQSFGVPGYNKKNQYSVYGDIIRVTKDFSFGRLTVGTVYENATTLRYIEYINLLNGQPDYQVAAAKIAGPSGAYVQTPLNISYYERSGWTQYQPFMQFEWKPTDRLTITPGVKYVHYDLYVHAPEEVLSTGTQPLYVDKIYTKTLPFLTANYLINSHWSVYAQYAQGFLVPKIGNLYVANVSAPLVPQESTNYQLGTVVNLNNLSFDADIYYIDFKHKIQTFTDAVTGQSYDTNTGGAYYQGIELEGAYVLPYGASVFANYSYNQAVGKDDPTNPLYNGRQLAGVPTWTAAAGLRVEHDQLFAADDAVIATIDSKWIGPQNINNATCAPLINSVCSLANTLAAGKPASSYVTTPVAGRIGVLNETDLTITYRFGRYSIEGQIQNLFDSRGITLAKGKQYIPGTNTLATTTAQLPAGSVNLNAFEYQVPRNFEVTLKARF